MAGTLSITNDNFQAGTAIVASEMNTNFTEVENYINNSMPSLGTASVFTAAVTCNAGFTSTTVTTSGELNVQDQACIRDDATPATITDRLLTLRTQTSGMVPLLALAETAVSGTTPVAGIFMIGVEDDGTNPDTNDYWLLFRKGNGDTIGSVQGTGSAGVAFQTSSDQTLKNDLGVVTEASSVIDALQVHKFTWKDADSKVGEHVGLFAQEAIEVLPYGIVSPASTRIEDGEEMYIPAGIDYSKIVPFLIAEIQSLRARVAAVEG